ncbi:MAG TPA: YdcF family protein [Hyphomicrobiaceae bacterium]|jgi:uncharacterized SAM-binding protein YcdF (DUF218 family)
MTTMRRAWRLGFGFGLLVAALVVGFFLFARSAMHPAPSAVQKADGIVALTGTQSRISAAGQLLAKGLGKRLLVTGVNRQTTGAEIRQLAGLGEGLFDCCVDLGYEAQDTIGNATETQAWAAKHGFSTLIVVTSSYHMPRSLVELGRVMPDVALIPYPVTGPFQKESWWKSPGLIRLLLAEYLKFLPSAARYAVLRLVDGMEPRALATAEPSDRS